MLSGIGFVVFILREGMLPRFPFCNQGILERRWATGTSRCSTGIEKKYQSGQLLNNGAKQDKKKTMYDEVKVKLLQYIELWEQLYTLDKCGLSWALLREKALFFAAELSFGDDFKASNGWIQSVLKAGGKKVSLITQKRHGDDWTGANRETPGLHQNHEAKNGRI
jgi:hypothetical protein